MHSLLEIAVKPGLFFGNIDAVRNGTSCRVSLQTSAHIVNSRKYLERRSKLSNHSMKILRSIQLSALLTNFESFQKTLFTMSTIFAPTYEI